MSEAIPPTGAPGAPGTPPGQTGSDGNNAAPIYFFPSMPFTPEEYKEFMKNEFKFLSQIIKHDMQKMKKAMQKMKRMEEGGE